MFSPLLYLGLATLTSVEAAKYGNNHVPTLKDPPLLAAHFPNPNTTLLSPAFLSPSTVPAAFTNGTAGPTSDAELDTFLQTLASRNPTWLTYTPNTLLSEEGRPIPTVLLSTNSTTPKDSKLRIYLQSGVHGNEPAGDQSLLAFLGALSANSTRATSLLTHADILLLPRYNPDGVGYFQRALASNYDPNRDHVKLARAQTRTIKRVFNDWKPHVAVDLHEFGATGRWGEDEALTWSADALFSAAKNLNIDPAVRALSEETFAPAIAARLESGGFRWAPYVTRGSAPNLLVEAGSDGKIGRNAMGLAQCVAILCEVRGIGIADQHFGRRVAVGVAMVEAVVEKAVRERERVLEVVGGAVERVEGGEGREVVVTDYAEVRDETFEMVDVRDGAVVQQPVRFASTTPTTANLTRARPEAYLVPRAWADVAERLEVLGLEVEELPEAFSGTVEALNVTSAVLESSYYEGVVRAELTTEAFEREVELPAGSFRVSTRQRNAALAFVALEPENIDSFAAFNIIPVEEGDEYPIFRILN